MTFLQVVFELTRTQVRGFVVTVKSRRILFRNAGILLTTFFGIIHSSLLFYFIFWEIYSTHECFLKIIEFIIVKRRVRCKSFRKHWSKLKSKYCLAIEFFVLNPILSDQAILCRLGL